MIELQHNFTTIDQSKLLVDMGLPVDTADCYIYTYDEVKINDMGILQKLTFTQRKEKQRSPHRFLPCWSLVRLIEIFDACYVGEEEYRDTNLNFNCHSVEDMVHMINYRYKLNDIDFSKL